MIRCHQNQVSVIYLGQARAEPADGSSGDRHKGGVSSVQAPAWNVGTQAVRSREPAQDVLSGGKPLFLFFINIVLAAFHRLLWTNDRPVPAACESRGGARS